MRILLEAGAEQERGSANCAMCCQDQATESGDLILIHFISCHEEWSDPALGSRAQRSLGLGEDPLRAGNPPSAYGSDAQVSC